jgi:hypothetical protein
LVVAGCFEYDQGVVIEEGGSGSVEIHYKMPPLEGREEGLDPSRRDVHVPELPFSERAVVDSFGGVPLTVKDVDFTTSYGYREISYRVLFENVEDLNGRGIFNLEGGKFSQSFSLLEEEDGVWKYEHTINFDWPPEKYEGYEYYVSECLLGFNVKVPGKIVESNGGESSDGTVTWAYTLAELLNQETTLSVTYRIPESAPAEGEAEGMTNLVWLARWSLCAVTLFLLAGVGLILALKKPKRFLFVAGLVKKLEKKSFYRIATGASLVALAVGIVVTGVILYIYIWSRAIDMMGLWRYAGYAYAVILAIIIYMATHATILRAKAILGLPENDYIAVPIVSNLLKLAGELAACAFLAVAIIRGGVVLLLLVAKEAAPATSHNDASICALAAGASVVFAFLSVLLSYLAAELVAALGRGAEETKTSRDGGR